MTRFTKLSIRPEPSYLSLVCILRYKGESREARFKIVLFGDLQGVTVRMMLVLLIDQ